MPGYKCSLVSYCVPKYSISLSESLSKFLWFPKWKTMNTNWLSNQIQICQNLLVYWPNWRRHSCLCLLVPVREKNQRRAWVREWWDRRERSPDRAKQLEIHQFVRRCCYTCHKTICNGCANIVVLAFSPTLPRACRLKNDVVWLVSPWNKTDARLVMVFHYGSSDDTALAHCYLILNWL